MYYQISIRYIIKQVVSFINNTFSKTDNIFKVLLN